MAGLAIGLLGGCSGTFTRADGVGGAGEGVEILETVMMRADYRVFESAVELDEKADTIVRGIVRSSKVEYVVPEFVVSDDDDPMRNPQAGLSEKELRELRELDDGFVATMHSVEITDVIQGDHEVGDIVTVPQLGGIYKKTNYLTEGLDQMSVGQEYLLFARQIDNGRLSLLNLDQTIYTVDEGGRLEPAAEDPEGFIVTGSFESAAKLFQE